MKKEVTSKILLFLFLSSIIVSIVSLSSFSVSAQEDVQQTAAEITTGVQNVKTVLKALLTPLFGEGEMATRIAFAVLLFMLIYSVMSLLLSPKGWIPIISSGAVTVLAMLAMPSGALEAIRTQYGAMGGALLTIIPIAILFVFTARIKSLMVARLMWVTFFLYYLILLGYGIFAGEAGNRGWYLVASIVTFIGFWVSGILRKTLFKFEIETIKEQGEQIIEGVKVLHGLQQKEIKTYKKEE